jgi:hypothetical protein
MDHIYDGSTVLLTGATGFLGKVGLAVAVDIAKG